MRAYHVVSTMEKVLDLLLDRWMTLINIFSQRAILEISSNGAIFIQIFYKKMNLTILFFYNGVYFL